MKLAEISRFLSSLCWVFLTRSKTSHSFSEVQSYYFCTSYYYLQDCSLENLMFWVPFERVTIYEKFIDFPLIGCHFWDEATRFPYLVNKSRSIVYSNLTAMPKELLIFSVDFSPVLIFIFSTDPHVLLFVSCINQIDLWCVCFCFTKVHKIPSSYSFQDSLM